MLRNTYHEMSTNIKIQSAQRETERQNYELIQAFLNTTGFPRFPLRVSTDEAKAELETLRPVINRVFPYFIPKKVDDYAEALSDAGDLEAFAEMTGTSFHIDEYRTIGTRTKYGLVMVEHLWELADDLEALGLLDLPEHREQNF